MLSWLFSFFNKDLSKVLGQTKTLRIKGAKFIIKKVDMLDHLKGASVMMESYAIYKNPSAPKANLDVSEKKIREHYSQVLVAGVVHPRLKHKDDEPGILVNDLFVDSEIVNTLYEQIMAFTYGKKKMKSPM